MHMEVLHISCNICTCDLPDMYALSPRASGTHIRQIPHSHVTTITYIFQYASHLLHMSVLQMIMYTRIDFGYQSPNTV